MFIFILDLDLGFSLLLDIYRNINPQLAYKNEWGKFSSYFHSFLRACLSSSSKHQSMTWEGCHSIGKNSSSILAFPALRCLYASRHSSWHFSSNPAVTKQSGTYLITSSSLLTPCSNSQACHLTAYSHIFCVLNWSGIYLNSQVSSLTTLSHLSCVLNSSGTFINSKTSSLTIVSHISCVLNSSARYLSISASSLTTLSHISCVLNCSGTYLNTRASSLTTLSHISFVLKSTGRVYQYGSFYFP